METIHIALASDDNYAQHVAVVIASIMKNTQSTSVCFHILSDAITDNKKEKLRLTAESLGAKVDIIELSQLTLFNNLFTSGHISRAAYFRLDIANFVDADIKKIIYMDVDLVVYGDVAELWQYDLEGYPLAAVPDFGIMSSQRNMEQKYYLLGFNIDDLYFNSGLLIIDLEAWRKNNYAQRVVDLAAMGNFPHHDQDALNKVFYRKWQALPLRWNVIPPVFNLFLKLLVDERFRDEALAAKKAMCIMHFAGRYKPWEFPEQEIFNDGYYKYLAFTAFKDALMPQPGKNMQGKSLARALWRLRIAEFWCKML